MYLPNQKRLNIDMEWLNEMNENMEVDIGYVNRMEIVSSIPSIKSIANHTENGKVMKIKVSDSLMKPMNQNRYEKMINLIKWEEEIESSEALSLLEKAFYPFKKISYYPFLESLKKAQELNKFVHFILLWGALDDQSC
ncbi:seleno N [Brachionus plicatilis]|uniref:Seleno N n=1 Tax=Brachionus plicatilis TaxID=10195 RepID=A0A3M7PBR3_BRAPC|nr:seleno N [Brachionus plicatilis]